MLDLIVAACTAVPQLRCCVGLEVGCLYCYALIHLSCCRANFRVLALIVGISALAACNALYVPLRLEQVIHTHPRSAALLEAAAADGWLEEHSHVTTSGLFCMRCNVFVQTC